MLEARQPSFSSAIEMYFEVAPDDLLRRNRHAARPRAFLISGGLLKHYLLSDVFVLAKTSAEIVIVGATTLGSEFFACPLP